MPLAPTFPVHADDLLQVPQTSPDSSSQPTPGQTRDAGGPQSVMDGGGGRIPQTPHLSEGAVPRHVLHRLLKVSGRTELVKNKIVKNFKMAISEH